MVIKFPISDHFPVCAFIQIPNAHTKVKIQFRTFHDHQLRNFREKFDKLCENFIIHPEDPNSDMSTFLSQLIDLINEVFPKCERFITIKHLNSPWINDRLLSLISKKHRIFSEYKDNLTTFEIFKKIPKPPE